MRGYLQIKMHGNRQIPSSAAVPAQLSDSRGFTRLGAMEKYILVNSLKDGITYLITVSYRNQIKGQAR